MASALLATTVLGAGCIIAPGTAHAQEAHSYDIPAGPLAVALNRFGEGANVELIYDSALTNAATSPGLKGRFHTAEALSRLLAGTGVTFRQTGPRVFTLERAPQRADGAVTLGPVRVQGEGAGRGTGSVRPPADTRDTYTVRATNSATKIDLAIKDTPQIVNVITRQRIEDQNLTQIADVLANTPGITVGQQGIAGAGRIQYFARGFPVTNVMLDGVSTTGAANRDFDLWSAIDTAVFDRVELVQGATGLATGAGDPSGSVNFVRKRPAETLLAEGRLSAGSWDRLRAEIDLSAPLNASGSIRARGVGAWQQGDSWQDRVKTKAGTAYGIIEADVSDNLLRTGGLLYTNIRADDAAPFGLSFDNRYRPDYYPLPGSTIAEFGRNYNPATQWTFSEIDLLNPFAKLEWRFDDNWRLNLNYMYMRIKHERVYGVIGQYYYSPELDQASYDYNRINLKGDIHNVDAAVTGRFRMFGRDNDLVLGFSGYWGSADSPAYRAMGLGSRDIAISQWNNGDVPLPRLGVPELAPGVPMPLDDLLGFAWSHSRLKEAQYGGYIGTRLRPFERLSLVLGGRINRWERSARTRQIDFSGLFIPPHEVKFVDVPGYNQDYTINGDFTPYAGVIFELTNSVNLYAAYARSDRANVNYDRGDWRVDINGDPLPPLRADTYEAGFKIGLMDGKLDIQGAAYRMIQRNFPQNVDISGTDLNPSCPFHNPFNPNSCIWPAKPGYGYRSTGFDFSVAGQISPKINLMASYSYLDQKFKGVSGDGSTPTKAGCFGSGTIYTRESVSNGPACPRHTIKLFGTYRATDDLTVGGGVTYKSATRTEGLDAEDDDMLDQGAYAVVDVLARYRLSERVGLAFNVNNLFDAKYYTSSERDGYFWGAPRNVMVSVNLRY